MSQAESFIKKQLDGTFYKYQPYLDTFMREQVPLDYIPHHSNTVEKLRAASLISWRNNPDRKTGRKTKRDASPEQTIEIKQWYSQGLTKFAIYKRLKARGDKVSERGVRDALAGDSA